jgi:hypothetical protein
MLYTFRIAVFDNRQLDLPQLLKFFWRYYTCRNDQLTNCSTAANNCSLLNGLAR